MATKKKEFMTKNVKHLNVHIPIDLDTKLKGICNERKENGLPNATMRALVIEMLQKGVKEHQKK
jgi:hypothetical protein